MATVSSDKTCKIFDLKTRKLIATLDDGTHSKSTRSVSFKPGTEFPTLAVGSFDATVSIWGRDTISENQDAQDSLADSGSDIVGDGGWELLAVIEGHENEVKSVDWSCDGRYLATCSRDKSVWIWETDDSNEEFECINVIQEHDQDVKHVRWNQSENILVTSSYDETCRIFRQDDYDEDDWVCVAKLDDAKGTVWCSDFEKKEVEKGIIRVVSCSDDGKVRIYRRLREEKKHTGIPSSIKDEEQWELESILPPAHNRSVYSVDWNDNGLIASCGSDSRLIVYKEEKPGKWQVLASKYLAHGTCELNCVKWCSDNELLTAGDDGKVKLWKLS